MKVSLKLLQWHGAKGLDGPVDELIKRIGSQLGAIEGSEYIGDKYQGVVIAKVVSCEKHQDSDHLNVCRIDDGGKVADVERGDDGLVQVVCGAPNVRAGLMVAWLPPGSTVPESFGNEPFVLGARELRGVKSNGMLASAKELAVGDDHHGIMELDGDIQPGGSFAEAYDLDDTILELENKMFTHRPDCFGVLGVAREINGIQGMPFVSPDWYRPKPPLPIIKMTLPLKIQNDIPQLVPRFTAVTMTNVEVKPSPVWLQTQLLRSGIRPISNIVDLTNYYMLVTGQPLHAYDYDKVKALDAASPDDVATLIIRQPKANEKLALLNGKTIEPRSEAILIASQSQAIGLGGVMGGAATEVSAKTQNIILECASFDMYSIRRTSMAHGLFSEAVTRNNKGQSPLQNLAVLARITADVTELSGGTVASEFIDVNQQPDVLSVHPPVTIDTNFITARLGLELTASEMATLLRNVEFMVDIAANNEQLMVTAPFWRTDIEIREDIVEEIGRLYGFDKLPLELPQRSIQPAEKNPMMSLKQSVRMTLAEAGANEVLTYSFVHGELLKKVGQDPSAAFSLSNALSPDLQYYRLSLTASLLDKVYANLRAGYSEFALFEIGKGHNLAQIGADGLPVEFEMLELTYARADKLKRPGAAFYEVRNFLQRLANQFGIQLEYRPLQAEESYQVAAPYDYRRSAQVLVKGTDLALGMIGEYKSAVRKALKLPVHSAGFGIGLAEWQEASTQYETIDWYRPQPRFPSVTQDITFRVAADQAWQPFSFAYRQALNDHKPDNTFANGGAIDIYQSADDATHKHFSFRLSLASFERTLTDAEVSKLLEEIASSLHTAFGAERI